MSLYLKVIQLKKYLKLRKTVFSKKEYFLIFKKKHGEILPDFI